MEQQKTKIIIITIVLLTAGLIGGWFFVVRNIINKPEKTVDITADIQNPVESINSKVERQKTEDEKMKNKLSPPDKGDTAEPRGLESVNPKSDNPLSERAFRMLLPPGYNETTRKRLVKEIYSKNRSIAVPDIAVSREDYEQKRNSKNYSLILEHIRPHSVFENTANFRRSEDLVSVFQSSVQSRSGAFTQIIPFGIDPLVLLVNNIYKDKIPLNIVSIEQIINNPSLLQSNYILDKWHLIKKKQQKSGPESYPEITDLLLEQGIFEENTDLLRLFLRLKQYPSTSLLQDIETLRTQDVRCSNTSSVQCLALTQQTSLLRSWMSDVLGGDPSLSKSILSNYSLQPIPTLLDAYPSQGWGRVVYQTSPRETQLAQEWIIQWIALAYEGNYDLRPHLFSAFQPIFQTQKSLEPYQYLKPVLNSLKMIPPDQSIHINEELLQVLQGDYNSDIWIRNKRK